MEGVFENNRLIDSLGFANLNICITGFVDHGKLDIARTIKLMGA